MEQISPNFWSISATDSLNNLQVTADGITSDEAQKRLSIHGTNCQKQQNRSDIFSHLIAQFKSPIILILLAATILSFYLHNLADATIILSIIIISGL